MTIQFYDVKTRKKIGVDQSQVRRVRMERKTSSGKIQIRYAVQATVDGRRLVKLVSERDWHVLDVPAAPEPRTSKK